ncbi:MAG: uL13 family ribosomal protein, partial [Clostridia bacterium]|nr:uL13 family ribosomal protein [Clostridia bacterium]
ILTGDKLNQKYYRHHSGWIGGLKEVKYSKLMAERPEFAMELAVKGMLPATTLGRNAMKRLRVYRGTEHKHQAQKPEVLNLD